MPISKGFPYVDVIKFGFAYCIAMPRSFCCFCLVVQNCSKYVLLCCMQSLFVQIRFLIEEGKDRCWKYMQFAALTADDLKNNSSMYSVQIFLHTYLQSIAIVPLHDLQF